MMTFFYATGRFLLVAATVLPIYLRYFWLWLLWKKLGRTISRDRWNAVHRKNAQKFYRLAVRMRGGLIKVGQLISARVDIMPKVWVEELSRLQDKVDPAPWEVIRKHLEREYGKPPEQVFAHIDSGAIAAASFGQVHRARTLDGDDVALKVRYPDVEVKLAVDLKLASIAVPLFSIFVPKMNLRTIQREMSLALTTELDYEQEAAYTRTVHENLRDFPGVVVPKVYDEYTTGSVICTSFYEGIKISNVERMRELGIEPREVLTLVLNAWTKMMYEDGVFQSDPHPGNILFSATDDGKPEVCIIDFGQTKILPEDFHAKLVRGALAFMNRDVDGLADALVDQGLVSARDADLAKPLIKEFFEQYYHLTPAEVQKLDFAKIREDVQALIQKIEGIHVPNDLVLYGRTFSLLVGLATTLDENANAFELARPFIMKTLMSGGPGAFAAAAAPAAS